MTEFWEQIVAGLASGGIYATLALALVLIHRATGVINFAQGEMGMFSTYIAWSLLYTYGVPYWGTFAITLVISFFGGVLVYLALIRPLSRGGDIAIVIATIALLVILNGGAGWIWSPEVRSFESPFPIDRIEIGGVGISLLGTYWDYVTGAPELELPIALAVLLLILLFRPAGLFGRAVVRRV